MSQPQLSDGYHFSLSLGKALFSEMLGAALPITVAKGEFDLTENIKAVVRQLQVKERVAGLLEERNPPGLARVKDKALEAWEDRREQVLSMLNELVRVEGDWEVELDKDGSDFVYGDQSVGAEAHVRLIAKGKAVFLQQNLELPFEFSKRVCAEMHIKDIRYDAQQGELVGSLKDLALDLGDNLLWKLLEDLAKKLLDQQTARFDRLPILKKEHLDGLLAPAMEPLKLKMDVEDLNLEVGEEYMTLKVRFGFAQKQLTED